MDYVIEVCSEVSARAGELRGYRIVDEPPALRHFTARFEPQECRGLRRSASSSAESVTSCAVPWTSTLQPDSSRRRPWSTWNAANRRFRGAIHGRPDRQHCPGR